MGANLRALQSHVSGWDQSHSHELPRTFGHVMLVGDCGFLNDLNSLDPFVSSSFPFLAIFFRRVLARILC